MFRTADVTYNEASNYNHRHSVVSIAFLHFSIKSSFVNITYGIYTDKPIYLFIYLFHYMIVWKTML